MKTLFVLPDHDKKDTPLDQMDFWKWLTENKHKTEQGEDEFFSTSLKKAYFKSLGFDKEIHTLGDTWLDDMKILDYCINYHKMPIDKA